MNLDTVHHFLIALLIGALVGLEREKKKASEPGHALGGIRTYTLLALVGAAAAWLGQRLDTPWVLAAAIAVVGATVIASYLLQQRSGDAAPGLTSEVAALVVCLLGAMTVVGEPPLAVALAVVTSALLAFKQPLHSLVGRIDSVDLFAGLKLAIASFIVLPLLPNRPLDPWQVLNPYELWLLVILISALSLLGYVAVRWKGATYGTAITGIAGGLVSSTATTASFARTSQVAVDPAHVHALTAGILLSWLVMFTRVLGLVAALNRALLPLLLLPFAAMALVCGGFALWHGRASLAHAGGRPDAAPLQVSNPFSLGAAMRFGALFALVMLGVKLAQSGSAGVGVVLVSALAGLFDVDAITLSLARGGGGDAAALAQAATGITVAVLANTVVKCGIVVVQGRGPMRGQVLSASLLLLALGGGSLALL